MTLREKVTGEPASLRPDEKKPREFWICDEYPFPAYESNYVSLAALPLSEYTHVIEYAAYEKLQSEVERLNFELNCTTADRLALILERDSLKAKLQAAEAGLRFERQAKQQRVLGLTLENANLRTDARLTPLIEALAECADALDEQTSILNDSQARKMIDSFTAQPGRQALAKLGALLKDVK